MEATNVCSFARIQPPIVAVEQSDASRRPPYEMRLGTLIQVPRVKLLVLQQIESLGPGGVLLADAASTAVNRIKLLDLGILLENRRHLVRGRLRRRLQQD